MDELNLTSKIEKRTAAQKSEAKVASALKEKGKASVSGDKVTLSRSFQEELEKAKNDSNSSPEIRHDLVNKFRNFLGNGTYVVKADEIADKIVQKIRESKNHHLI